MTERRYTANEWQEQQRVAKIEEAKEVLKAEEKRVAEIRERANLEFCARLWHTHTRFIR